MRGPRQAPAHIDWSAPDQPPDWLFGTGATPAERRLVLATCGAGVLLAAAAVARTGAVDSWQWWHWLLSTVLVIDVAGGVAANGLGSAKRFYHSPLPVTARSWQRLLHHPAGFAAAHVHPFVAVALFPGGGWDWAATWYLASVAGTAAVVVAPVHLQRPLALAVVGSAVIAGPVATAPAGLNWLGPLLVTKLVLAHAVHEEPYRPGPSGAAR